MGISMTNSSAPRKHSRPWARPSTIIAALILVLTAPATSFACELRMGWEPWKPYQYRDDQGDLRGLDIDLIRAIANRMDCELALVKQPWMRHLRELREGRVDLAAGADYTPERADFAYFSRPYRTETVRLFMRQGEPDEYELSALKDVIERDLKIGITQGYDYGKQFEALRQHPHAHNHIETTRSDLLNYRKLARKRIDAILADPLVLRTRVKGSAFEDAFEAHPLRVKQAPIHVMFSRASTSKALVQRFNNALEAITGTGMYDRIFNRYNSVRQSKPAIFSE
ncbi:MULTISPECIES: substrate-binding periplasmic protein [Halomonadaceae]|uniref:Transporter substrate-binding domain-containing protein n=1 Tax=Vreelandella halophila TaxID=86177 RepID=A0A9X4YFM3_9GAMM|nr:transporter substrate-binding domain-containing protein [Halomonas utahensis]MYL75899.1 transporter substrate-binding domain-containing protein [Halomonas sp. 22501_18_FS]